MDWLLNNLENVVIPIIILILYGIGSAAQRKEKKAKKASQNQRQADPEEAKRVQQIQAEIRRKIAERTGRAAPPVQKPAPVRQPQRSKPAYADRSRPTQQPPRMPEPARRPTAVPTPSIQAQSYQAEIEAKMRQVRELEAQAKSKSIPREWGVRTSTSVSRGELRSQLFQDLAHPLGQKKAILVGEILGSPVGIKGPAGWKSSI